MATAWQNYLTKLTANRSKQPEIDLMSRTNRTFTEPFSAINRKLQATLNMDKASIGAKIQASLTGQQQTQDMQEQMSNEALNMQSGRIEKQDSEIAKAQMAIDQEKEAKKAERAAKNTSALRAALSAAGMLAGGLLALPTGGMSLMAGSAIGGALGSAAGGFVGVDQSGKITADPEQWDSQQIVQGLQETGTMLASQANTKQAQGKMNWYAQNGGKINKLMGSMDENQATQFNNGLLLMLQNPNSTITDYDNYVNGYNGGYSGTMVDNPKLSWGF